MASASAPPVLFRTVTVADPTFGVQTIPYPPRSGLDFLCSRGTFCADAGYCAKPPKGERNMKEESEGAVSAREVGDVESRHAGHLHQAAVMRAVGLKAVLDIAHFLGAVARLQAVGQDEGRRGSPDVARAARLGIAILMDVPAGHQGRHDALQRGEQRVTRRGIDEAAGDLGLARVAVEQRLVQE